MMNFRRLLMSIACFGVLCSCALLAQPNQTVTAGKETTLVESTKKVEVKTPPRKGTARVASSGTAPDQKFSLIYKADDTSERASDQMEYTIEGQAQTLTIQIEPRQLELDPKAYAEIFKALILLFMLAVVLESALAVLFNWRPFVETLNARAVRPVVSFLVGYLFVEQFNLDLMTSVVNAATTSAYPVSSTGKILTALVLAGGSAGVNNLLVALGYRQKKTPETVTPTPPPNHAWVAIRLNRLQAEGPVQVFIGARPAANALPPLVGVIHGRSKPVIRYFFSDPGRFPGYGGHQVPANIDLSVELIGRDHNNADLHKTWGPYTVAGGAIINLDFDL
jgi:hypothetical protein